MAGWMALVVGSGVVVGGVALVALGFDIQFCTFDLSCQDDRIDGEGWRRAAFWAGIMVLALAPFAAALVARKRRFVVRGALALASFFVVVGAWQLADAGDVAWPLVRDAVALGVAGALVVPGRTLGALVARGGAVAAAAFAVWAVVGGAQGSRPATAELLVPAALAVALLIERRLGA